MMNKKQQNVQLLKYVSLVTLTLQNAMLGLSMRYARTRSGDMFLSSTEERTLKKFIYVLKVTILDEPMDTLKVCVPSLVYIVQNNLLYVSASHLDAATYQVTYQLKILTTAFFAVTILRRSLRTVQWGALVLLLVGVVLVQLAQSGPQAVPSGVEQNRLIGFSAALIACFLSGFAGIYFEKILKGSDISVWMRNVQLSFLSLPFGLFTCFLNDSATIHQHGFFFGYDWFVHYLILLQAGGGLIVAMVVKHADNILKGFATSLAIVISCVASIYLFDFKLTFQFALGATLVICSIFMYSHEPKIIQYPNKHTIANKV
ncbi:UDP-galactose/UDP-N-acetylglucosamine transporter srf-3 isoform X2 [Cephus cinctus]|uniref:UDP-galactose/UDP-N-acetylglucosamine transporter srf-3 isoform X2 n=2 Tax=Cephus cinctus TaxID=211228 RepID=A0AAJ7RUR0_CEPCN|nr:UDP-galactose/UDP-N-acetylglucosamine transporter srf-3 isoform X2 [Cephus cinctus]